MEVGRTATSCNNAYYFQSIFALDNVQSKHKHHLTLTKNIKGVQKKSMLEIEVWTSKKSRVFSTPVGHASFRSAPFLIDMKIDNRITSGRGVWWLKATEKVSKDLRASKVFLGRARYMLLRLTLFLVNMKINVWGSLRCDAL